MPIQIPLTPEQFAKAQLELEKTGNVGGANGGTVKSHDIDFDYTYDGQTLSLTVTAKHTIKAKLASDDEIKARVEGWLA